MEPMKNVECVPDLRRMFCVLQEPHYTHDIWSSVCQVCSSFCVMCFLHV